MSTYLYVLNDLVECYACFKYLGCWTLMVLGDNYRADVLLHWMRFPLYVELWFVINFLIARINYDDFITFWQNFSRLLFLLEIRDPLINCCPVCGEILQISDRLNAMIHLTLCFDEGTGNQVMTGGFLTDKQASNGWGPANH